MTLNGNAIKKRRDELGLTQEQLKERTNVEVRTIQRAEAGTSISNANAALLAQGLGVSVVPAHLPAHQPLWPLRGRSGQADRF